MINSATFIIQTEAKDNLIAQVDLFCYSLNKFYPQYKTIILSEGDTGINRPNTKTVVVPNTIYPALKEKLKIKILLV